MSSTRYLLRINSLSSSWVLPALCKHIRPTPHTFARKFSVSMNSNSDKIGNSSQPAEKSPSSSQSPPAKSTESALPAQQKTNVLNVNINYQKIGNGPHPLLLLPGALGFIESDFGPILHKFNTSKFTVVVWDPPGYGKSRPPDRNFRDGILKMFINDAFVSHALMQKLGFKTFSAIGWSDGAITALIQTTKFQKSIEKLVVFGGNAFINQTDVNLYLKVRNIDTWSDKMKAPMIEMYGERHFRKLWTEWVDATVLHFRKGGDLCSNEIANITCPTLVIHGLKDPMVGLDHAEFIHQKIKSSKLHVMPEGKHNLHLRYPDEFIQLVESFFLNQSHVQSVP